MKALIADLAANLRHGLRAMLLRSVALADFRATPDQVVALAVLTLAGQCAMDVAFNGLQGKFNVHALAAEMTVVVALLLAALVAARLTAEPRLLVAYPVALLAMDPFFLVLQGALRASGEKIAGMPASALYVALLAWCLIAAFRVLVRFAPGRSARTGASFGAYLLLFFGSHWGVPAEDLWVARAPAPEPAEHQASVADEAVFHAQPALLESALAALRPQRDGVPDIYFVGFGAYSAEDVFMKEVEVIAGLFQERFDTGGRSVSLINNARTAGAVPIATATNLARVLRHLGGIMNRDEDVLVLYLTTHGTEQHRLAVVNRPLRLQDIDPQMLARMLDESGIKWRVLAISACYAGGFIDPLKNDATLIMAAADARRQSFGCGTQSDFTYFGKALFDEELRRTLSLTEAFERARLAIAERERAGNYEASNPQIHVGAAMPAKLRELETRLRALLPRAAAAEEER